MRKQDEIIKLLDNTICKEIVVYFLNLINKRKCNIESPINLSLNPNVKNIKKCLTLLYCPENMNGEIEAEKHIKKCVDLNIFSINYKDKKCTFPLYKRKATLTFNLDYEDICRNILGMEVSTYNQEWIKAIELSKLSSEIKSLLVNLKSIEFKEKSAIEIIANIESYLSLNRKNDFIREASSFIFWGHSKVLDNREDLWNILKIKQQPIQILISLKNETSKKVLFIENKQTFESLQRNINISQEYILMYLSGFMGTSKRLLNKENRSFYLKNYDGAMFNNEYLDSIFDSQTSFQYYFWGDLDYEGINIYSSLQKLFPQVILWEQGYKAMSKMLFDSKSHTACSANKTNQHKPEKTNNSYIDDVLIPLMDKKGFFDQEGILF